MTAPPLTQVQKQMIDEHGNHVAGHNQMEIKGDQEEDKDSDSDFNDGDESYLNAMRDERISKMKAARKELEENMAKGHGHYTEIVEEFLCAR